MNKKSTLFICVNLLDEENSSVLNNAVKRADLKIIKIPCTGMIKKVFLLRAFEAGSDRVVVLGCKKDKCRYIEGSIRAEKRVIWTKRILDEIEIEKDSLSFSYISPNDNKEFMEMIQKILTEKL